MWGKQKGVSLQTVSRILLSFPASKSRSYENMVKVSKYWNEWINSHLNVETDPEKIRENERRIREEMKL